MVMACGVDPGTSVLEGSGIQENWARDFGSMVGGGGGDKAGERENILGAINGGGGSSGSMASAWGRQHWQSPKPPPLPLLVSQASLAREAMARMLLFSLPSLLVGMLKPIIISLNFLLLVVP